MNQPVALHGNAEVISISRRVFDFPQDSIWRKAVRQEVTITFMSPWHFECHGGLSFVTGKEGGCGETYSFTIKHPRLPYTQTYELWFTLRARAPIARHSTLEEAVKQAARFIAGHVTIEESLWTLKHVSSAN